MRNLTNIFKVLLIMLIIFQILFIPNVVQADAIGDGFSQATDFINNGKEKANQEDGISTATRNNLDIIYNVLLAIGTSLAVIIGGILGIKFMIASAEDKAKIKEALVPYILGCVIIFGAFGIWKLTVSIGNSISSETSGNQKVVQTMLKADEVVRKIESGELNVSDKQALTDDLLKDAYRYNQIGNNLNTKIRGDARAGANNTTMTLEEALSTLSRGHKALYNECIRRGFIKTGEWFLTN